FHLSLHLVSRNLHPFPTRRSSDLHDVNEIKIGRVPGFEQGYRLATEQEILSAFGCPPGYLGPIDTVQPIRVIADTTVANMADFIDRKSTRLNSSHVSISYAVFCLK